MEYSSTARKQWRFDTPGATNRIHLNNAGAALMPKPVIEAIRAHLSLEMQIGGYEAAALQAEALQDFYVEVAGLLNTDRRNIAFAASATDAYSRALSSIPLKKGEVILTTEDDYVSNHLAFLQLQDRWGVRLERTTVSPSGGVDLEDLERKVQTLGPKVVAVTHVPTNSGLVQDVVAAGKICRDHGCYYLVDACQSAGQMPLDVQQIGCDFLTATFRKFLRGPRGAGFLFVADRVLAEPIAPLFVDLQSAEWTGEQRYDLQPDARRYELWERSWALVAGAREAVRYARSIGMETIQAEIQVLADHLRQRLEEIQGVSVLDQGVEKCGIVTAGIQTQLDPSEWISRLRQQRVNASISYLEAARFDLGRKGVPWVLRLSPHYYNTRNELDKAIRIIEAILR